jgi:hypothetical protein
VPYPDKLLAEDEEVVRHLHPHWLTLARPLVVRTAQGTVELASGDVRHLRSRV